MPVISATRYILVAFLTYEVRRSGVTRIPTTHNYGILHLADSGYSSRFVWPQRLPWPLVGTILQIFMRHHNTFNCDIIMWDHGNTGLKGLKEFDLSELIWLTNDRK